MKENFIISITAVLPMFLMMCGGALARKGKLITKEDIQRYNHFVFVVFYPFLMFNNLYGKDIAGNMDVKLVVYAVAFVIFIYIATTVIVRKIEPSNKSRGAMIQAVYRSNYVIIGLPVVENIFKGQDLSVTAMLIAITIPLYNVLAVATLEYYRGGKPNWKATIISILKNPLIIGTVAAFIVMGFKWTLPSIIESTVESMAKVATPMALVLLGANFSISSVKGSVRNLAFCVLSRLVFVPALGLTGGILMGFRGIPLASLIALYAAPTALASYTMAESMDSDGELAGNAVIFSSMFGCFTMFLWIFIMKSFAMI